MFLRAKSRCKDGKVHRYGSIVENRRTVGNRVVQRQVLYLGEINDHPRAAWCRTIEVLQEGEKRPRPVALFPEDRPLPALDCEVVRLRLAELQLRRPRPWGACWWACQLWAPLHWDPFWAVRWPPSRQGTRWLNGLKTLVCYRLIEPGSEWRLHRDWSGRAAMADLLGEDDAWVQADKLYRCLDKLLAHKRALCSHLTARWQTLFGVRYEVLLYDLPSTYFECEPPDKGKRRFGYSRDKRAACVQVVIALSVTLEGLPLTYEVLAGNTSDKTPLPQFLKALEDQYGQAERVWVRDRGLPTDETLQALRETTPPVHYRVGTPKGRLNRLEQALLTQPWAPVRESVQVKLLEREGEL